jgi:hypothetical protein
MTEQQQFVYHLVPKQMEGHRLYPLNRLREVAPDLVRTASKKYAGRESVLARRIPPLNCMWPDVLMFCPVHPRHIMETFRQEGYEVPPKRWFEVPLSRLEPENTAVFFSKIRPYGDDTLAASDFALLADVDFEPLTRLPDTLREHIQMARSEKRTPLLFVGIPHILYRGTLSLDGIEVVEF